VIGGCNRNYYATILSFFCSRSDGCLWFVNCWFSMRQQKDFWWVWVTRNQIWGYPVSYCYYRNGSGESVPDGGFTHCHLRSIETTATTTTERRCNSSSQQRAETPIPGANRKVGRGNRRPPSKSISWNQLLIIQITKWDGNEEGICLWFFNNPDGWMDSMRDCNHNYCLEAVRTYRMM
jgi:hypothetical protein